jgi:polyhydroxyalkanoate synthesis regulator phasin
MARESGAEPSSPLELLERLVLAAFGAVALTAERAEELARDLADRGEMQREDVRQAIEEAMSRWRGDANRLTERTGTSFRAVFDQLGLVGREAHEELELRVAQLEHRLRLAEAQLEGSGSSERSPGAADTDPAQSRVTRANP